MELWGELGKISTVDKVIDKETDDKGDEQGRGGEGTEMETGLEQFINSFPSQPAHDDIIRALIALIFARQPPLCLIHDSLVSGLILAFAPSKDTRIRSQ
jgi:hypothetical protein